MKQRFDEQNADLVARDQRDYGQVAKQSRVVIRGQFFNREWFENNA